MTLIKRIRLFLYFYFIALREPVHDAYIRSVSLAWQLARIAA